MTLPETAAPAPAAPEPASPAPQPTPEPVIEMAPTEPEPEPEVIESPSWEEPEKDWPHEWIEFEGDKLAVRKPTQQALAAYSLSASRFVDPTVQNDITGLFVRRHMSEASYLHVMDRFMAPDDPDYDETTVGELMRLVVELATGDTIVDNRAARRAQK